MRQSILFRPYRITIELIHVWDGVSTFYIDPFELQNVFYCKCDATVIYTYLNSKKEAKVLHLDYGAVIQFDSDYSYSMDNFEISIVSNMYTERTREQVDFILQLYGDNNE